MQKHKIEHVTYVPVLPADEIGRSTFETAFTRPWGIPLVVRRDFFPEGKDGGNHYNEDFFVLYIVRGGRGVYRVDGHPYGVARGDVYILSPHLIHGFRDYHAVELDMLAFQTRLFHREELAALRNSTGFWRLFLPGASRRRSRSKGFQEQRLHLTPRQYAEVENTIERIRDDISEPGHLGAEMARHRFFCLLGTLARWHGVRREEKAPVAKTSFHAASLGDTLQFCEEHFAEPLSVTRLAARTFLSPDHFSRLFTAITGVPPATYLRRLRLERAQSLLRDTTLNTTEIAKQCGFAGREQMVRAFRAAFGTTPSGYRGEFRGYSNLD